jgi:hypothetical protein
MTIDKKNALSSSTSHLSHLWPPETINATTKRSDEDNIERKEQSISSKHELVRVVTEI